MGRVPRIQVENAIYYVTPTGDHDEPIFKEGSDYTMYAALLDKYKKQYKFKLFAFCFTPNSVNLLMEPSSGTTISQIMHDVNSNYTKYFNKKYKKQGHLFQERYRKVLIEKTLNLLNITACIHLRPKLLNLSDNVGTYKYSSFMRYLNEETRSAEVEWPNINDEVLEVAAYLNGGSYREFIESLPPDKVTELDKVLGENTIIGSDEFIKEVKLRIESERHKEALLPMPEIAPEPKPQPEPQSEPASSPKAPSQPKPKHNGLVVKILKDAFLTILVIAAMIIFIHTNAEDMNKRLDEGLAAKNAEIKRFEVKKTKTEDEISRLEAEKTKTEDELLRVKLRSVVLEWLSSAKEKQALEKGKLVNDRYVWAYSFQEKEIRVIKSPFSPSAGYAKIDENLYIEKYHDPGISDITGFRYTVTTPVELNFVYRDGKFVPSNIQYGQSSTKKGWPQ